MLIVGDLNIAASQQDVHDKLDREAMYSTHEKELFDSLLAEFADVWRHLHPDAGNVFTVWDEKTNARAFNEVIDSLPASAPGLLLTCICTLILLQHSFTLMLVEVMQPNLCKLFC